MQFLFAFLLSAISLFLILLVLVQRGRGGGLTGALGGMGGQSAFGTKAGDTFTRVTVASATIWILCAILAVKLLGTQAGAGPLGDANAAAPPAATSNAAPGTGTGLDGVLPSGAGAGAGGAASSELGAGVGAAGDAASGGESGGVSAEAEPTPN